MLYYFFFFLTKALPVLLFSLGPDSAIRSRVTVTVMIINSTVYLRQHQTDQHGRSKE
jgi:hypothetical protein